MRKRESSWILYYKPPFYAPLRRGKRKTRKKHNCHSELAKSLLIDNITYNHCEGLLRQPSERFQLQSGLHRQRSCMEFSMKTLWRCRSELHVPFLGTVKSSSLLLSLHVLLSRCNETKPERSTLKYYPSSTPYSFQKGSMVWIASQTIQAFCPKVHPLQGQSLHHGRAFYWIQ